ncbi:TAXI family TRAP transporter solute-binding subunit [Trinickia acidisoli]|uniref:TAXI family TRAP transporter solute-binding subunit n=1 Tax=Trinickia acidisoli TaxID=2767482 RepID=UPI001A8CA8D3|nr:TAXI family TRAP transporter solute-binding subunit [Trinickia acidisoli]
MRRILPKVKHARAWITASALGVLLYAAFHVQPSRHIRIAAGPVDGSFYATALQYKALIERKGYRVDVVPFENTNEIEAHVADDRAHLDLGFVADSRGSAGSAKLMSLGDIQLQPIFIFENRHAATAHAVRSFSDLRGLSLVLPPRNSLTSETLLRVFALSGIDTANTGITFLPLKDGIAGLERGEFDAGLFILGADSDLVANLAKDDDLVMVQIAQQDAIAAKLAYLSEVKLPEGVYDVSRDVPAHDVKLLAATISVVARRDLPPATVYAVLEALRDVHRRRTYVNDADAFPRDSDDAAQPEHLVDDFYRNGTPWIFAHLPVAIASVVDAYLGPLLALWVATGALNVVYEVERVRLLLCLALAHLALWWIRRRRRKGVPPPHALLALARKLAAVLTPDERGAARMLAELRRAIGHELGH